MPEDDGSHVQEPPGAPVLRCLELLAQACHLCLQPQVLSALMRQLHIQSFLPGPIARRGWHMPNACRHIRAVNFPIARRAQMTMGMV